MMLKVSIVLNLIFLLTGITAFIFIRMDKVSELEKGRESYEEGNYCQSIEHFFKSADFDISYYELIGKFYLKGYCVTFSPQQAAIYYKRVYKTDIETGRIILLETLDMLASEQLQEKSQILEIFKEVKRLGFKPTSEQIESLKNEEFKNIF